MSDRFRIFNNAIECEKFAFSASKREAVRSAYGIKDEFLIGHVGRFAPQKNHARLLKIFKAVQEKLPSARLMLLGGTGPLDDEIRRMCHDMGLDDAVIFAGVHENVEDYYSAMDVLCFPSLFEGLSLVAVEAQTNGLPCVAADTMTKSTDIGAGLFEQLSLEQSDEEWADAILAQRQKDRHTDGVACARKAGYDAATEAGKLQEYYCTRI